MIEDQNQMDEQIEQVVREDSDEPVPTATAELRLVRGGQETTERFSILGKAVIGRFDPAVGPVDVDLAPIPEGIYVSRKHAEIRHEESKWFVRDLGSSNGTFVLPEGGDFEKIEEDTEIASGQRLSFGNAHFVFHVVPPPVDDVISEAPELADIEEEAAPQGPEPELEPEEA